MQYAWLNHGTDGAAEFLQSDWVESVAQALGDLEEYPGRNHQIRHLLIESNAHVEKAVEKMMIFDEDMVKFLTNFQNNY